MELVSPGLGLIFWMVLAFGSLLFILKKFAWAPILESLKEREQSIEDALHAADKARQEMVELKFSNEQMMAEAKEERDELMRQTRIQRDKLIEDAKVKAGLEAERIVQSAREAIENERMAAVVELRNQIARLSIEIAEKLLERELDNHDKQAEYANQLIEKVKLN
jgi:F-type H+-transporting ATPase subunit b